MSEETPAVRHSDDKEQLGFTMIPNAVLLDTRLSLPARVLYGALKYFAWSKVTCYPGQERLSTMLGVSERSIRTYLHELMEAGLIATQKKGFQQTTTYLLLPLSNNPANIAALPPTRQSASAQSGSLLPLQPGSLLPPNETKQEKKTELNETVLEPRVYSSTELANEQALIAEAGELLEPLPEPGSREENIVALAKLRSELGL